MRRTWVALSAVLIAVLSLSRQAAPLWANPPTVIAAARPGVSTVEVLAQDWHDSTRDRDVPAKIYFPKSGTAPLPVIVFSHGLGGSRDSCEYLGRYWASHGYVSLHLQHHGSDTAVWKGKPRPKEALRDSVLDLRNSVNRPLDVRFAIDKLEKMNRGETSLRGRLDLTRIGMSGHSFGAWTTLAVIGEAMIGPGGLEITLADPRVKAAVALSAPVVGDKKKFDQAYGPIKVPCLYMTGTLDDSPIGETMAKDRRVPFDHIHDADQYLVVFNGGDHMVFSGRGQRPSHEKDALFQKMICVATTAFWDAYLKDDKQAKIFLTETGVRQLLGKEASFEKKQKAP